MGRSDRAEERRARKRRKRKKGNEAAPPAVVENSSSEDAEGLEDIPMKDRLAALEEDPKAELFTGGESQWNVTPVEAESPASTEPDKPQGSAGFDDDFIPFGSDPTPEVELDTVGGEEDGEIHTCPWPWAGLMKTPSWRVNTKRTLHDEIVAFCRLTAPTKQELQKREEAGQRLRDYVQSKWPGASVEIYGSHVTGLSLFCSDIDTVVMGTNDDNVIYQLGDGLAFSDWVVDIQVIDKARVPIIKYVDEPTQVAVDVSFNEASGIQNTRMMRDYVKKYPAMPPLVIVIKYFLKQRGLDDTYTGGIGSYVLANLVVSYLQQHPRWAHLHERPEDSLGIALIEFFQLYGTQINFGQVGISVRDKGKYFPKKTENPNWKDVNKSDRLCLEDPHNPERDVGAPSFRWDAIRRAFSFGHRRLRAAMRAGTELSKSVSALALVINVEPALLVRGDMVSPEEEVDLVRVGGQLEYKPPEHKYATHLQKSRGQWDHLKRTKRKRP